jgi:hypothetical protein
MGIYFQIHQGRTGDHMKNRTLCGVIALMCLVASGFFFASGAMAAVTENECIIGGGSVVEGSGCRFCVGGKYDLSEIKDVGKSNTPRPESGQEGGGKTGTEPPPEPTGND